MKTSFISVCAAVLSLIMQSSTPASGQESKIASNDLIGVWEASRYFGPAVHGNLEIVESNGNWSAQIAQFDIPITRKGDTLSFELPGDQGAFDGRFQPNGSSIRGHWIQPRVVNSGRRYASPVVLRPSGKNAWRGEVTPLRDELTLFLALITRPDGSLGALIRNPDRNNSLDWRVDRLERTGNNLKLIGKMSDQAEAGAWPPNDQQRDRVIAGGRLEHYRKSEW